MKKALIYTLLLTMLLSLAACHKPKADQPAEPQEPEAQLSEAASGEPATTQVEPDPQEEPTQADPTEPVEGEEDSPEGPEGEVVEPPADTVPVAPAEKPQEVILPEPSKTETELKPSQEPVSQPPAQQEPAEQQPAQEPQQQDDEPQGGGDSAADIEARKKAFLENMEQMFEDHGYSTGGVDHDWTEEEKQALLDALGR